MLIRGEVARWRRGVLLVCALLPVVATGFGGSSAYASVGFAIERYAVAATEAGGPTDTQAGSHPFELTAEVAFDRTTGSLKDLHLELPPGVVLDGMAVPRCISADFMKGVCPSAAAVGAAMVRVAGTAHPAAVYELDPAPGEIARLGFTVEGVSLLVGVALRPGGDGMALSVDDISQVLPVTALKLTLWGDPGGASAAFVTLPTSCAGPSQATALADSWQEPGEWLSDQVSFPQMTGCRSLQFAPALDVAPDGAQPGEPSGYEVDLHVLQNDGPAELAPAQIENASVTFPEGAALSLSATNGLADCEEAQFQLDSDERAVCPEASKVGLVRIDTPLLARPLEGAVYMASPNANPLGALIGLYVAAEEPVSGLVLKLVGQLVLNPATGQPTLSFDALPQLSIEGLELYFFGGERSLLANPQACGSAMSTGHLTPWSATAEVVVASTFEVSEEGDRDGACASPLPFAPALRVSPTAAPAGGYSQFEMVVSRESSQQGLAGFSLRLPAGLQWVLASVPPCAEPQAGQGTCAPASEIGTATASLGPVPGLAWFTGPVYLTGGYAGGQYGLSIALDATTGPFDLGELVIRAAVGVDPGSEALTITSAPLPQIIDGIPLRTLVFEMAIDRSEFVWTPTLCESGEIIATLEGTEGGSVQASDPFTVESCQSSTPSSTGSAPSSSGSAPSSSGEHGVSSFKSSHETPISHIHERMVGDRLILTFKTSIGGIVAITGPGVLRHRQRVRKGADRAKLTLTRRGLFDLRHHRPLELRLTLQTASGPMSTRAAFTPAV